MWHNQSIMSKNDFVKQNADKMSSKTIKLSQQTQQLRKKQT